LSARTRQPGHDRSFVTSETNFVRALETILDSGQYEVRDHPSDLLRIFKAETASALGIRPEASVRSIATKRVMYFEVKKQGDAGNAEERAFKHHTVQFYKTLRTFTGLPYHAYCTIFSGTLGVYYRTDVLFVISRSQGYQLSAGKEEGGLLEAARFFREVMGTRLERVESPEENYRLGDFRTQSGVTLECKRQPIDPRRYPQNFVEVFELTANERHRAGFRDLAALLGLTTVELESTRYQDHRGGSSSRAVLGRPDHVSVSITSIAGSAFTIYVNPDGGHLYLYESAELMGHIRTAVRGNGLHRGMGRSNEDTFAVLVPLSEMRWSIEPSGSWRYSGSRDLDDGLAEVQKVLAIGLQGATASHRPPAG
jgi:hypothetical protein